MARPKKNIDKEQVAKLAALNCTFEEIAAYFDVDKSTISRRFATDIKKGREIGKISLRRNQFNLSKTNPGMAIFLGKVILNQKETGTPENETTSYNSITNAIDANVVFFNNLTSLRKGKKILLNRGGTRSGKTYSIAQMYVDIMLTGKIGDIKIEGDIGVFRKSLPHLKKTVLIDIEQILQKRGLEENRDYRHHRTEHYFEANGRKIYYDSINTEKEIQKVRGLALGCIWFNEANESYLEAFKQLRMRGKKDVIIFLDFNPDDENVWLNEELEKCTNPDLMPLIDVIVSTYKDNIFMPEEQAKRIESFRLDTDYWNIYGKGQYGTLKGLIYKNWQTFKEYPIGNYTTVYGHDFGFTADPSALLQAKLLKGTNKLFLESKFYRTGMYTGQIIQANKEHNKENHPVFGDCSDPRIVSEMRNAGINIFKPKKGISKMIDYVNHFDIFVHEDDIHTLNEIKKYKYMLDENGKSTGIPIDFNNHLMDALGYLAIGLIEFLHIPLEELIKFRIESRKNDSN